MMHYDTLNSALSYRSRMRLWDDLVDGEYEARKNQIRAHKPLNGMDRGRILDLLREKIPSNARSQLEPELQLISKVLVSQNQGRLTLYEYYLGICELKGLGCSDRTEPRWAMAHKAEKAIYMENGAVINNS